MIKLHKAATALKIGLVKISVSCWNTLGCTVCNLNIAANHVYLSWQWPLRAGHQHTAKIAQEQHKQYNKPALQTAEDPVEHLWDLPEQACTMQPTAS